MIVFDSTTGRKFDCQIGCEYQIWVTHDRDGHFTHIIVLTPGEARVLSHLMKMLNDNWPSEIRDTHDEFGAIYGAIQGMLQDSEGATNIRQMNMTSLKRLL